MSTDNDIDIEIQVEREAIAETRLVRNYRIPSNVISAIAQKENQPLDGLTFQQISAGIESIFGGRIDDYFCLTSKASVGETVEVTKQELIGQPKLVMRDGQRVTLN